MERLSVYLIRIHFILTNLQVTVAVKYLRLYVTQATKVSVYSTVVRGMPTV